MRGCLFVLLLGVAVLAGVAWFGGPPIAGAIVATTLTASGFEARTLDVVVEADPPLTLAVGRADRVSIEAEGVAWNDLRAESMELELTDVDLLARTAVRAVGRFDDVELASPDEEPVRVDVAFEGPAGRADTTVGIDRPSVIRLAIAAFEAELNIRPDAVALVAPDTVRFTAAGQSVDGRLRISADGAVEATTPLGTVRLVETNQIPLTLTGLTVGDDGLELLGRLDIASLLEG